MLMTRDGPAVIDAKSPKPDIRRELRFLRYTRYDNFYSELSVGPFSVTRPDPTQPIN